MSAADFERLGLSLEEQEAITRSALEDTLLEDGSSVLDNPPAIGGIIKTTEYSVNPKLEASINAVAAEIAQKHGVSVEKVKRLMAKRVIEIFQQQRGIK